MTPRLYTSTQAGDSVSFFDHAAAWGLAVSLPAAVAVVVMGSADGTAMLYVAAAPGAGPDVLLKSPSGGAGAWAVIPDVLPSGHRAVDAAGSGTVSLVAGDLLLDGWPALIAADPLAATNTLLRRAASNAPRMLQDSSRLLPPAPGGTALRRGAIVADLNADGVPDLAHGAAGGGVFLGTTPAAATLDAHNWFTVRPVSMAGARTAFGATVHMVCVRHCPVASGSTVTPWHAVRIVDARGASAPDATFGVPHPFATYNLTMVFPWGTVATFATHSALGSVVPASLPPADRIVMVRPQAPTIAVGPLDPWDTSGQFVRPVVGSMFAVPVHVGDGGVMPPIDLAHPLALHAVAAVVNGIDVTGTFAVDGPGRYTFIYEVPAADGGDLFPWSGLHVTVRLADAAGLESSVDAVVRLGGQFRDVTGTLLPSLQLSAADVICAHDVNFDGLADVFVADGTVQALYVSLPDGTYVDATGVWGIATANDNNVRACSWVRVGPPASSRLALAVASTGSGSLWLQSHGVSDPLPFFEATAISVQLDLDGSNGMLWRDFNGDGALDVFAFTDQTKPNQLLLQEPDAAPSPLFSSNQAVSFGLTATTDDSLAAAAADVDGDGHVDLLVATAAGSANVLHLGGVTGVFTTQSPAEAFGSLTHACIAVAAADVTGNGRPDVLVMSGSAAVPDKLLLNDGVGQFPTVQDLSLPGSAAGSGTAVLADVDLDGFVDVLLGAHGFAGALRVLRQVPPGTVGGHAAPTFTASSTRWGVPSGAGSAVPSTPLVLADVDGDLDLDVLTPNAVLLSHAAMVPEAGDALVVRPVSVDGTSLGLHGTVVRVVCVAPSGCSWTATVTLSGHHGPGAVVGVPAALHGGRFNVSVAWAGACSGTASPATHPGLGLVALPLANALIVRPEPAPVVVIPPVAWTAVSPVPAGTVVYIGLRVAQPNARDFQLAALTSALVNGNAATYAPTHVPAEAAHPGETTLWLRYVTPAMDSTWPWDGLRVQATLVDSCGLHTTVDSLVVPGLSFNLHDTVVFERVRTEDATCMCVGDVFGDGAPGLAVFYQQDTPQLFVRDPEELADSALVDLATSLGLPGYTTVVRCAFVDMNSDGLSECVPHSLLACLYPWRWTPQVQRPKWLCMMPCLVSLVWFRACVGSSAFFCPQPKSRPCSPTLAMVLKFRNSHLLFLLLLTARCWWWT